MRYIFVIPALLLSTLAIGDTVIPDTVPGKFLAAYLAATDSRDRAQIEALNATYHQKFAADFVIDRLRQTGGLVVLKIEKSDPLSITAVLQEKDTDSVQRMTVTFNTDDPTKILAIVRENATRPPELAIPRMTQAEVLKALSARANALVDKNLMSGAMLISDHGKVVFEKSWGFADREKKTPITAKTKFRLGSANKMFTAVSVLQLVQEGKLSLDETINRHWPDYPNKDIASKVTIRELLNHTGGTGDIFGPEFDANRMSLKTINDYVALYGARGPAFEPGTKDSYSNYGFILLGKLIEKVSGVSYDEYIRQHIFRPAGMTDTDSRPEIEDVPGRSVGYMWKDGAWVSNADTLPYRGTPAGGGYSTLDDLVKFAKALESGKLLSKQILAEATVPQNSGHWYGYGFITQGEGEARYYGHEGGAPGMNAEFRIFPELDVVIVALSNFDPPGAVTLVDYYTYRMPLTH